jgi:ribonuclease G
MSKELVISSNRHETRVALLEDDQLVEVYFQRSNEYSLAGSIHKGRVTRVLPGMQSAFVDVGLERDTFLYVSDFLDEHSEDIDRVTGDERAPREARGEGGREGGREGAREGGREGGRDGGRDRNRDRDRGRGRDGRDRDRERPPQAAVAAPAVEGAPADVTAQATPAPSGEPRQERRDDRGGRRGRRRGRGRSGFPDSKYSSPDAANEATAVAADAQDSAVEDTDADSSETSEEVSPAPQRVLLPGEFIAKYRRAETAPVVNPYDEPVHAPLDNAIPDAPVHLHPEPLPAEGKLETEDALDLAKPEVTSFSAPTEQEIEEAQEAAESGLVGMAHLDEDEDRDIQDMILDSIGDNESGDADSEADAMQALAERGEDLPIDASVEDAVEEAVDAAEASAEAEGAEPTSGSAEVREQSGRSPHRVSRRGRRRRGGSGDRGGDRNAAPAAVAPADEVAPAPEGEASAPAAAPERAERPERQERPRQISAQTRSTPSIADLLKQGQEIIVQIAKEPLGTKGARITSHVALPGRFVVYMPTLEHMGVSRRIGSDEERLRLKRILKDRRPGTVGGFITRTAAEGRTEDEIAGDMEFLYNLWTDIKAKADKKPAPALLHHDLDIVQRILRDQLADDFKAIWIDNEETFESILRFVERFQPALVNKVKMYTRDAPIFDSFGITQEMEKALRPKVWLKSGGYLVINQTEALVAIDINTGKYVGKSNRLEDTIVKTNTEAIKEIVRQIRLRDLGGIIIIDFIDMDERKNRAKVMAALEDAMRADRAPYKILQFNDFGLVAITRKRVKQSLERTLCSPCPNCEGAGYIKSVQTVITEILAEARKLSRTVEGKDVMLRVHPDVAKVIKSHQNKYLEELEETLRRPVLVKSDPLLHNEKFDLA